jgi:hypothetical protein
MIPPVIPQDKLVIINLTDGRALVARYIQTARFRYEIELAANADQLAFAARQALEDMVGEPVEGQYPCPPALADEAIWE